MNDACIESLERKRIVLVEILRRVYEGGHIEERGPLQDKHCRYCDAWLDRCGAHEPEPHADDCLWRDIEEAVLCGGSVARPVSFDLDALVS